MLDNAIESSEKTDFEEIWESLSKSARGVAQILTFFDFAEGIDSATISRIANWYNQGHSEEEAINTKTGLEELQKKNVLSEQTPYQQASSFENQPVNEQRIDSLQKEITYIRKKAAGTVAGPKAKDIFTKDPGESNYRGHAEYEGWNTSYNRLTDNFKKFLEDQLTAPGSDE